jgi:hypothetical protein
MREKLRISTYSTYVLYKASEEEFEKGYQILKDSYPEVEFIEESVFYQDVLSIMERMPGILTAFGVDDNIFKEDFSDMSLLRDFYLDSSVMCFSMRLGLNTNYCYPLDSYQLVPNLQNNRWSWRGQQGDWGYPMSLDFHAFRHDQIYALVKSLSFTGPNELEGVLAGRALNMPFMMCASRSIVMNIPTNRVQELVPNRYANTSDKHSLNRLFLGGVRIDVESYYGINNNSCHYEIPLVLKPSIK